MKKLMIMSLAAATLAAVPTFAKEKPPVFVEAKVVKDAKVVKLDPAKAYVYIRTPNAMPLHFTKIPSAEDQIAYDKLKAAAFAEAREDYAKALKRYERDLETATKTKGMKKPTKPVEPTESNFQFQQFGQLANFTVGAFNRFHNKDGSVYLHEVTPGTYRIFGQVDPLLGMGVCYCMGSVTFNAEAGKIVDLGSISFDSDHYKRAEKGDSSSPIVAAYAFTLLPATTETSIDPRVASFPRMIADFRAAGKAANYMGIAVSRIPAIPGVIAYERDWIVDLKASAATASPTQ
jgi:hypothetical protein